MISDQRRKRRRELQTLYTDTDRQQSFFKFLESPKTTCPARNFLFWLDVEAYRLQRKLAKGGGVVMTRAQDYEVCRTIFEKYVKSGAPYPIFMPNYTKLDITSSMARFHAEVAASVNNQDRNLCDIGDHVFDEAQNAVELSLYRALSQFEGELQQEKKVADAVLSTDSDGASVFVTGSFEDLLNWFFLDCRDDKFVAEFERFLCIYRLFETPDALINKISLSLHNPGNMTMNNFDKDLIIARTKNALRMWITSFFHCDIEGDQALLQKVQECVEFSQREHDDKKIGPLFRKHIGAAMEYPDVDVSAAREQVELAQWTAMEISEQLTLVDAFSYYAVSPDELFAIGEPTGAVHLTFLSRRVDIVASWVAFSILQSAKPAVTARLFVSVLEKLFSCNNYNGVRSVLSGLDHPSVTRLRKVVKGLEKHEREFLEEMRQLMETTDLYKKHLESVREAPCIPYTGTMVMLMTEAYARNASKTQTDKGINYVPVRAIAEVMFNYLRFQRFRYTEALGFQLNARLYAQLTGIRHYSDEELHAMSVALQPLDRKEKKGTPLPNPTGPASPNGLSKLASLLRSPRPKKLSSQVFDPQKMAPAKPRSSSIGDSDAE